MPGTMTPAVVAFFRNGVAILLLLAVMCEASQCRRGRSTYMYKPKTRQTIQLLENCDAVDTAYICVQKLATIYDPKADFVDFDSFARKYVACVTSNNTYAEGMNLSYISPKLPGFYVQMSMKNMVYQEATKITNSLPEVLLVKKFHNQQVDDYVKSEVMQSVERTQTSSNEVSSGFSTSASVEAGIKTPFVEASVSVEANFALDSSNTQTQTYTKTFSLTDTIVVPPNSTVKLVWSISQNEMNLPWTGQLQVKGWIPVKLKSEADYSFLPVGHMAAFFDEFFELESSTSMIYHTAGNFRGVTAVDSHIDVVEMPLHADQLCPKRG